MKKIILALLLIVVSVAAFAQKSDSTDLTLPKFEVKDQNGHSQRFTHPRMKRFKGKLYVNGKARGEKAKDSVFVAPVEAEPSPILIPAPQQTITELEAKAVDNYLVHLEGDLKSLTNGLTVGWRQQSHLTGKH